MNIFITGCSAHLAKTLLPLLCSDERVTRVTGVDIKPCRFTHKKFTFHRIDIRDPSIQTWMKDHDALIHLAFVVLRGKMPVTTMHDINVEAGFKTFKMANEAGITRLIHLSSAAIYGNGDNVDETAPFAPIPGFVYAEHKAELEQRIVPHFPWTLRLRPHIILGKNALPLLKVLLRLPFYVKLPDPQPLLQCVHEKDVARAIVDGVFSDATGAMNLAADDGISYRDMVKVRLPFAFDVALERAQKTLYWIWRLTGWGGEPAWLGGVEKTLTLNCQKAKESLHWTPTYSARAAVKNS